MSAGYFLKTVEVEGRQLLNICSTETGEPVTDPMEWDEATRRCIEMNKLAAPVPPAPAAPCCDCRERVKRLEAALREMTDFAEKVGNAVARELGDDLKFDPGPAIERARAELAGGSDV